MAKDTLDLHFQKCVPCMLVGIQPKKVSKDK